MGNPYEPLSTASENLKKDNSAEEVVETTEENTSADNSTTENVPDGNISEINEWVGDDKDRAQLALDAENEQENPRKTLVKHLEEVING